MRFRLVAVVIAPALAFSLSACQTNAKAGPVSDESASVSEELQEAGDSTGESSLFADYEWPNGGDWAVFPSPGFSVAPSEVAFDSVVYREVSEKEVAAYVEQLRAEGFWIEESKGPDGYGATVARRTEIDESEARKFQGLVAPDQGDGKWYAYTTALMMLTYERTGRFEAHLTAWGR